MKIDSIGFAQSQISQAKNKTQASEPEIAVEDEEVDSPEVESTQSQSETPGVIRLLQEGHFKGVADIRLRINFHEELQAMEAQNLNSAAADGFEVFNQAAQEQAAALTGSGLLTEEQQAALDAFLANLQTAQSGFMEDPTTETLMQQMQDELDSLLGLLTTPAPTEPEIPVEQDILPAEQTSIDETAPSDMDMTDESMAVTDDAVIEEPVQEVGEGVEEVLDVPEAGPLEQLVQSFQEAIQTAIDQLQSDLNVSSVLPPVSEPSGNGKAYAKFLAIYESMLAGTAPETESSEQLDILEAPLTGTVSEISDL